MYYSTCCFALLFVLSFVFSSLLIIISHQKFLSMLSKYQYRNVRLSVHLVGAAPDLPFSLWRLLRRWKHSLRSRYALTFRFYYIIVISPQGRLLIFSLLAKLRNDFHHPQKNPRVLLARLLMNLWEWRDFDLLFNLCSQNFVFGWNILPI